MSKVTGGEKALRILIVTDAWYPQINGVVRTYEYLRTELTAMGHDVSIIGPADFPLSFAMPGYHEIRLAIFPYARLRRAIAAYAPDLLHIATEGPLGLAARRYAARYGVSFTSCYHTHFPDYVAKRVGRWLPFLFEPARALAIRFIRWFHSASACVFVSTPSLAETLRAWNFSAPLKHMTRGIDHNLFVPGQRRMFGALKKPVALYVGRVAVEKNLEAFLSMTWHGDKVVVGAGPDEAMLKARYPNALFSGPKTGAALADCYRSADVFVFPSKTDTFGMVIVEALACGLPVAAFPVTGPVDIITGDLLGALDDNLGTAALRALNSPGTPAQRAAFAKDNYDWRVAAAQFLDLAVEPIPDGSGNSEVRQTR